MFAGDLPVHDIPHTLGSVPGLGTELACRWGGLFYCDGNVLGPRPVRSV
jgi:hypothetical protein